MRFDRSGLWLGHSDGLPEAGTNGLLNTVRGVADDEYSRDIIPWLDTDAHLGASARNGATPPLLHGLPPRPPHPELQTSGPVQFTGSVESQSAGADVSASIPHQFPDDDDENYDYERDDDYEQDSPAHVQGQIRSATDLLRGTFGSFSNVSLAGHQEGDHHLLLFKMKDIEIQHNLRQDHAPQEHMANSTTLIRLTANTTPAIPLNRSTLMLPILTTQLSQEPTGAVDEDEDEDEVGDAEMPLQTGG
ncbi:hypothetical protein TruAng_011777 [Truncatella angustata]|nr:hypothetical protein TruAng_011777 [Truncatella angustata]